MGRPAIIASCARVQVVQGLAVVHLGGGLDAVGAAAEEDLVDVQFEDVFFGQDVLDLQGQDYLVEFAQESLVLTEEEVARHLHGDGGAAGAYLAVAHQFAGGTRQALEVNAVVTEEAFVFGRGQGLDEILRDLLELDRGAALFTVFTDQVAFAGNRCAAGSGR